MELEQNLELHDDGTEEETLVDHESEETPFDADKIRIEQRMLSLKYMKELINDGMMDLSPEFQRNYVWNEIKRKSLLIESLILRIPIPAFYFYEDDESILHVIDGVQRLTTINLFLDGKFRLKHLQYLHENCDNKKFDELDNKYKQRIHMTQFSVNVIDARTPTQVKYDLFRRINTGGVALNSQEIRNSIAKPSVRKFLKKLANSDEFLVATGGGVKDVRMTAQELVLRFVAFYEAYDWDNNIINYNKSDLEEFLDKAFERINNMNELELRSMEQRFTVAMKNSYKLFGERCFRKYNRNNMDMGRKLVNKSLFASVSVILSHYNDSDVPRVGDTLAFKELVELISEDNVYSNCLTSGTNAVNSVQYNFKKTRELLEGVLIRAY